MGQFSRKPADLTMLHLDGMADYRNLERWGIDLVNKMAGTLRASLGGEKVAEILAPWEGKPPPHGPDFHYDSSPDLFLGRRGYGPLRVAWDTNLLVDYFKYGRELWSAGSPPDEIDDDYAAELEGLQLIVSLWVLRDIRFSIIPATLTDGSGKRDPAEGPAWRHAFDEFRNAIQLVDDDESEPDGRLLILPDSEYARLTSTVPKGYDRRLVEHAARTGQHVFLTRDKRVVKKRKTVRQSGLLLMSPLDLFEELMFSGAFNCFLHPRFAFWPMPDQQRVAHLINALPDGRLRSDIHRRH